MTLQQKLKSYRINQKEYEKICVLLNREPQGIEWALFSALWSEHCSYKSSRTHLKGLFNKSPRVLQSFGENAGVVDLGEGERIAFKMESHNHPSFIEPYQGAATGVGGILRDVFTMGARPVALANYLCFGEVTAPRMKALVDGVVRGISGYGNCVGVPNISGQTEFHKSYNNNILVNAFALGLFRPGEPICLSKAKGPGNYVVYVGAKTGRDGVHGASMASESFDEDSESKRPTIQIGDPFFEKLLIESCLEVMKQDLVVAIQDMGAAGLTSSSFEMAAKGGVGLEIDLAQVPLRDSSLTPEDILLSESQERMLLICEPSKFKAISQIFSRWNLDSQVIGHVKEKPTVVLKWKGEVLTEIDPKLLVDDAPIYNRDFQPWAPKNRVDCDGDIDTRYSESTLKECLKSSVGGSRKWIYRQYDQRVGAKTARDCGSDLGVLRLPDSGRALGIALGCRPHVMRFDAEVGGADAVAFPALELAAKGFEAVGVTDCLNFGNPEKTEIMSEFVASLRSMSRQCEALVAPIISGNVSFYNETDNQNITSTPSTGVVGIRAKIDGLPQDHFVYGGEDIYLLSMSDVVMGGLYQEMKAQRIQGVGQIDVKRTAELAKALALFVNTESPSSTKLVGKFGLGYTLARMCTDTMGARIETLPVRELWLEVLYQMIVVGKNLDFKSLPKFVDVKKIGVTAPGALKLGDHVEMDLAELKGLYERFSEEMA